MKQFSVSFGLANIRNRGDRLADWPISETAEPDWLLGLALSWLAGFLLLLKLKVSFTQNETDMQGVCVCVCVFLSTSV